MRNASVSFSHNDIVDVHLRLRRRHEMISFSNISGTTRARSFKIYYYVTIDGLSI